jgi:hypothetical protein
VHQSRLIFGQNGQPINPSPTAVAPKSASALLLSAGVTVTSPRYSDSALWSMVSPGPIVDDTVTFFM